MPRKNQYQDISVGLNEKDRLKLAELAGLQSRTKTEIAREAIRFYLNNYENIKNQSRDHEIAEAIKYATNQLLKAISSGVDRICKMLARQGAAIGTLKLNISDQQARNQRLYQSSKLVARHIHPSPFCAVVQPL